MPDASLWFRLTVAVLATWRACHLVAHEDGPFDVIVQLRARAGNGMLGRLMDCPYCLSLWFAAPLALLVARPPAWWCAAWLAVSGGSSLLERIARAVEALGRGPAASQSLLPQGDLSHVMLRQQTRVDDDPGRPQARAAAPRGEPYP
jgi:hypothetical protein